MIANKKLPLFIITGASGVGKSTISEILFQNEEKYIVLESDILWHDIYNTPDDDYRTYRELWLNVCKNISQIGLPVVLCGCAVPKQFEVCLNKEHFTTIHYISLVCQDSVLEKQMTGGRSITDKNWINGSKDFNQWLKDNADKTLPKMELLDITHLELEESATYIDEWICGILENETCD